jgi:hypothetical protein
MTDSKYQSKTGKDGHITHSVKTKAKKRKKGALQHHADAKRSAKNANEFAGLTAKKGSKTQKRNAHHMSPESPTDMGKVKKYGKWAKEEAADAHKSRSAALKANKRK